ncbi:MAG TPA: transcriptional activator NhaR [Burkholderiales bacterium]
MSILNYKHLHYFWVVAKAGGVARASERLHVTAQTISGQIGLFEHVLGCKLFTRNGRRLELTDAGRMVLGYAEGIFALGGELEEALRRPSGKQPVQFRVGVADAVPKSVAYRLLKPTLALREPLRILCREGALASLLGDLAIHRLDVVLANSPVPDNINVRCYSHLLGECGIVFFSTPALAKRHKSRFPQCLNDAPLLLPGEDAAMRTRLMRWFDAVQIRPRIIGEFDDDALLKAFGQAGAGVFVAPSVIAPYVRRQYGVVAVGSTDAVTEQFYAISVERRLTHPAVVAVTAAARRELFAGAGVQTARP